MNFRTLCYVVPPLLLLEGIFSGSEIALLSADQVFLRARATSGSWRAKLALELARSPERTLSSTLVVTAICIVTISATIALYTQSRFPDHSDLIAILITSPLIVIFGELLPKTIYQRYATALAPWVAIPVQLAYWVFYPITKFLSIYTNVLARILRPIQELFTGSTPAEVARDELLAMLSYGKRESAINDTDKRMIQRIFDFREIPAKQVMIPLVRVEAIAENSTLKTAIEKFKNHRHSRMPVYADRVDHIVGVLEMNDLIHAPDASASVRAITRAATYVSGTHRLEGLLPEMKRSGTELVIVVDEYGGAVGILTFEDIVEQIVGEIADEHDEAASDYQALGERKWLIQGRMTIAAIRELLHLEIPEGDYETLAGFLLDRFAKIPEPGDELDFDTTAGALRFTIRRATERQIQTVTLEKVATGKTLTADSER